MSPLVKRVTAWGYPRDAVEAAAARCEVLNLDTLGDALAVELRQRPDREAIEARVERRMGGVERWLQLRKAANPTGFVQ